MVVVGGDEEGRGWCGISKIRKGGKRAATGGGRTTRWQGLRGHGRWWRSAVAGKEVPERWKMTYPGQWCRTDPDGEGWREEEVAGVGGPCHVRGDAGDGAVGRGRGSGALRRSGGRG